MQAKLDQITAQSKNLTVIATTIQKIKEEICQCTKFPEEVIAANITGNLGRPVFAHNELFDNPDTAWQFPYDMPKTLGMVFLLSTVGFGLAVYSQAKY